MPQLDPPPGATGHRAVLQHAPEISAAYRFYRAAFDEFTTLDPILIELCRIKSALIHETRC